MPVSNQQREQSRNEKLATGPQGIQGIRGEKGDTGPPGPRGPKGDTGDAGSKGERGANGPSGEKGPPGPAGAQGVAGQKGDKGFPGDPGPKGAKGDPGPPGEPSRTPGPVGPTGGRGETGPAGETGPRGDPGEKGDRGERGPAGLPAYDTAKAPDDQTSSSPAFKDIMGLSLQAEPGTDYAFEFVIPYMGDIVVKLEGPRSPVLLSVRTVDLDDVVTLTGLLRTGTDGGALQARFRPASAGSAVTIAGGAMARWHTY